MIRTYPFPVLKADIMRGLFSGGPISVFKFFNCLFVLSDFAVFLRIGFFGPSFSPASAFSASDDDFAFFSLVSDFVEPKNNGHKN